MGFNAPLGFESQRLEFLTGFTSGKEALEGLKSQKFDLLLTDLMMQEMDGESINPSYIDF